MIISSLCKEGSGNNGDSYTPMESSLCKVKTMLTNSIHFIIGTYNIKVLMDKFSPHRIQNLALQNSEDAELYIMLKQTVQFYTTSFVLILTVIMLMFLRQSQKILRKRRGQIGL